MPMTRSQQPTEREKTLLWVTDNPTHSRALIEDSAREFELVPSFCAYAELWSRAERSDVVAIELDANRDDALGLLKGLHERLPRLVLLAVSADTSLSTLRAAIEAGATDFLSLPLNPQDLQKAFIKSLHLPAAPSTATTGPLGDVISIYGVRGGLGATTLAVNLAVRLSAVSGVQVGLVDLDLQRGDVAAFLNLTPAQSLAAMASASGEVDEFFLHGTLARHPSGVFVLPAPQHIEEAEAIGRTEVEQALRLLRGRFPYTVVDTARTLTEVTIASFDLAARILLLTDLSVPSVRATGRTIELLRRLEVPAERVELVVTEAIPGPVTIEDAVRTIGKQPFLIIPHEPAAAAKAMNAGAPLNGVRDSDLAIAITQLAGKLTGTASSTSGSGHLLRRIFGRGKRQNV
jgi:pilus assembly protein CpaE